MVRPGSLGAAVMVLCLALAFTLAPAQADQVRVKEVKVVAEDDKLVLQVDLSGRLTPKLFPLGRKTKKPRVVIDFVGAQGRRLPESIKSPSPMASAVRVGRHPDKIRVVIDLVPGRLYHVEQWFRRDINRYILVVSADRSS